MDFRVPLKIVYENYAYAVFEGHSRPAEIWKIMDPTEPSKNLETLRLWARLILLRCHNVRSTTRTFIAAGSIIPKNNAHARELLEKQKRMSKIPSDCQFCLGKKETICFLRHIQYVGHLITFSEYCSRMRIMRAVSGSFLGIWKLSVVFLALFLGIHELFFSPTEGGRLGLIHLNSAFGFRVVHS